jgi:hypothetical protein
MKGLCLCLLLLCSVNLVAQQFNFPKTTEFFDLPGDHFMSYEVKTGKVVIRENDVNGDLFWTDTLSFSIAVDTIDLVRVEQFGNSSKYVFSLQKMLYPYSLTQTEFSTVYQFTQFDLSNHTFGPSTLDTLISRYGVRLFSYNDSAVNVLYRRHPDNINDDNYEVWSLNTAMQLSPLAPYQNTIATTFWDHLDMAQDTIRQYISYQDGIARIQYTPLFAQIPPPQAYFIPSGNFDFMSSRSHFINSDSLLLFHQSTMSGNMMTEWGFTLLNNRLDPLSGYTFTAPTTTDSWGSTLYYQARQSVYKDGFIYVFASLIVNGYHPRIFVYDLNFVLQCEIDVPFYTNDQQFIGGINDQVYFYAYTAQVLNEYCYFKVENCQFLQIPDMASANNLQVYPNPSDGTVAIALPENAAAGTLCVFNLEGKSIQNHPIHGNSTIFISLKDAGVYTLEVQLGDEVYRRKLIIQ